MREVVWMRTRKGRRRAARIWLPPVSRPDDCTRRRWTAACFYAWRRKQRDRLQWVLR